MKRVYLFLVLAILCLSGSAETFKLLRTTEYISERGDVTSYVLMTESNQFSFIPPSEWQVSSIPSKREVNLVPRDLSATIALTLLDPGQFTNSMPSVEQLQEFVSSLHPGAKILHQDICYCAGKKGVAFDLRINAAGRILERRIAFIPIEGAILEFSYSASPQRYAEQAMAFRSLLTSFRVDRFKRKS